MKHFFHPTFIISFLFVFGNQFLSIAQQSKGNANTHKKPNILICVADDWSFPHINKLGCKWVRTPNVDKIIDRGVLFTNAYTPNAKCAPSRASIITGRNSWQLEAAGNHYCYFPEKFKTYIETLKDNGYTTGFTGKGWSPGDPGTINGETRQLVGKGYQTETLDPLTNEISNNDYAANFDKFLDAKSADKPFHFWFGCNEPHRGYEFGSSLKKGNYKLNSIDEVPAFWPNDDSVKTDMLDYAMELEHFDTHLGRMIESLEKRGLLENTIIVVTADNGMPFPRVKGQTYEMSNHLPLLVLWPSVLKNKPRVEKTMVSFVDLAPTFLDVAGIIGEEKGMQPLVGKSLIPLLVKQKTDKVKYNDFVLIGKERHDIGRPDDQGYPIRGIVQGDYLYICNYETNRWPVGNPEAGYPNCDASATKTQVLKTLFKPSQYNYWQLCFGKRQSEEFYNRVTDPYCVNNLIDSVSLQPIIRQMASLMSQQLSLQNDPRMKGQGYIFDDYPYAGKDRFYYNRLINGEKVNASWLIPDDRNYIPKK